MFIDHLSLIDFRSYPAVEIDLDAGVTIFQGANGQGKTNLVEAVEYISTLSSHRVSSELPLVRAGAGQAIIRVRAVAGRQDARSLLLELEINPGRANRARVNKAPQPRSRDLLGALRSVLFAPEDLSIVKGDPADRRAFLDQVVIARWPRMSGVKADYERVLRQRNALLRSIAGRSFTRADPDARQTLEVWDLQLVQFGAELLSARLDTLAALTPFAAEAYSRIAPLNNAISAQYRATVDDLEPDEPSAEVGPSPALEVPDRVAALADRMLATIARRRDDEIARGVSLVGPHRDEVLLSVGELPAKGYASHGESWSLALALRLGGYSLLRADGVEPVLILDDVFAELDATRRQRLAEAVADAEQVLVTAAVPGDVPQQLNGRRFEVRTGSVTPVDQEVPADE